MGKFAKEGSGAAGKLPRTIYADYQATTPVDPRVLEAMAPFWRESFGNPHSNDHVVGWSAAESVNASLESVASLIGADSDEVIFTSGATEANNLALLGLGRRAPSRRRRILVSAIEHKCVLAAAQALSEREGFRVETIPVDRQGFVDLAALEDLLDEKVLIASVMAVNNEIGTIQDIAHMAPLIHRYGAFLHCDAAQAPCAMDLRGLAHSADLVSLSGHKMYGPQGIGALYIRRELHNWIEPVIYGGGQQGGLRSGTVPVALCTGMAAAAEIMQTVEAVLERERVAMLRNWFVEQLQLGNDSIRINGPLGAWRHPGNINLRFEGVAATDMLSVLQPRLAASTGAACTSGITEPSHVLSALGLTATEAESSIRFSFGRFSSDEEIVAAVTAVAEALVTAVS